MNENCLAYGIEISDLDWEKTPAIVKELVEKMGQHIKQSEKELTDLKAQQQELLEKINRTSKNLSSPPSLDPPNAEKHPGKKKRLKLRTKVLTTNLFTHQSWCGGLLDKRSQNGSKIIGWAKFQYLAVF
ncbi:hypothetical protein [uncultured Nostoc sp.]|uniref:hypothetical protein n=1 Tax=uncultured Nostoc sp. TaxID=340711 RepID=UPI0035CAD652